MSAADIVFVLLEPMQHEFGVILVIAGLYSVFFNVKDAKHHNHQRAEQVARIGGWCYFAAGLAIVVMRHFG